MRFAEAMARISELESTHGEQSAQIATLRGHVRTLTQSADNLTRDIITLRHAHLDLNEQRQQAVDRTMTLQVTLDQVQERFNEVGVIFTSKYRKVKFEGRPRVIMHI